MTKRRRIAWIGGGALAALLAVAALDRSAPPDLGRTLDRSQVVLASDGRMLRAFAATGGYWRLPATPDTVDPLYLAMLVAYEDKRFARHLGVDPLALARAAWQAVRNGRVVSGASTLTMQTARLLEPRPRSAWAKLMQMARAVQLERRLSKDQILSAYLTIAPFGGNIEGVRAASLAYFGKEPARLTPAEAALLVILPKSPERFRPDRFPRRARAQRDAVLERMVAAGVLTETQANEARQEPVPATRRPLPFHAPHLARRLRDTKAGPVRTTIDVDLQRSVEALAANWRHRIPARASLAILVRRNATGDVAAYVGSADFFSTRRAGQVDMVRAVRSPGSTLKPFIYAMAFDDGVAHPETLVDDAPTLFGDYEPENFSREFSGEVTIREALQRSLNVPAVAVLDRIGPGRFAARMARAGVGFHLPSLTRRTGLPVALGGVGVTLEDLVALYGAFADRGAFSRTRIRKDASLEKPVFLFGRSAAWQVARILEGVPRPGAEGATLAGRRAVSWKTGTSYGFRDAWAVGFDRDHTVGVWVGHADGTPSPGSFGRTTAGPLLFAVFDTLPSPGALLADSIPADVARFDGKRLPPYFERLNRAAVPSDAGRRTPPPRIVFPPDGAVVELGGGDNGVVIEAAGGVRPLRWMVNGQLIETSQRRRRVVWRPDGGGFNRITVIDAKGRSAGVQVRIQ